MKKVARSRRNVVRALSLTVLVGVVALTATTARGATATHEEMLAAVKRINGSGSCEAAGYKAPPKVIRLRENHREEDSKPLLIAAFRPAGHEPRYAGHIRLNVPGECTGFYYWDNTTSTLFELGNTSRYHLLPLMLDPETAEEDVAIQGLRVALSRVAVERKRVELARGEAAKQNPRPTTSDGSGGSASVEKAPAPPVAQAAVPTTPATYETPQPAPPAPTPQPVIQTVYRDVPVETSSRLMQLVESRLGWLVCGGIVLGILVGLAMRGSRSGQIVISPEEHARAAAQLEERLRADAERIKRLSNAVDLEEARYIQRVSAITRRS